MLLGFDAHTSECALGVDAERMRRARAVDPERDALERGHAAVPPREVLAVEVDVDARVVGIADDRPRRRQRADGRRIPVADARHVRREAQIGRVARQQAVDDDAAFVERHVAALDRQRAVRVARDDAAVERAARERAADPGCARDRELGYRRDGDVDAPVELAVDAYVEERGINAVVVDAHVAAPRVDVEGAGRDGLRACELDPCVLDVDGLGRRGRARNDRCRRGERPAFDRGVERDVERAVRAGAHDDAAVSADEACVVGPAPFEPRPCDRGARAAVARVVVDAERCVEVDALPDARVRRVGGVVRCAASCLGIGRGGSGIGRIVRQPHGAAQPARRASGLGVGRAGCVERRPRAVDDDPLELERAVADRAAQRRDVNRCAACFDVDVRHVHVADDDARRQRGHVEARGGIAVRAGSGRIRSSVGRRLDDLDAPVLDVHAAERVRAVRDAAPVRRGR